MRVVHIAKKGNRYYVVIFRCRSPMNGPTTTVPPCEAKYVANLGSGSNNGSTRVSLGR